MMKKLYGILKKYKTAIISALVIILIGIVALQFFLKFNVKSSIKKVEEKNYVLQYDISWKVDKKSDNLVVMKHKSSDSLLKIQIITLNSKNKYSAIVDLIDEITYNIKQQNSNYKLLSKQRDVFTKYQFNGYKMLYETDNSQTMISTFKKSDKLIIISYEAKVDYFDILLDSVHGIIYSFDTKEEQFDLSKNLKLDMSEIEYFEEKQIEGTLDKTKQYEIADKNYQVSFSIPSNFHINELKTTSNSFEFKGLKDGKVSINVNIYNRNIYEYLDKDYTSNLYGKYKYYNGENDKDYSGFKENISKLSNDYDSYIYKNSYYYDKATTYDKDFKTKEYKKKYENIELIYALNENHILIIKVSSSDLSIPKKLIDMIVINEYSNYSSYVKINKKEGYLIGELKRFINYEKNTYDNIIIKIPEKYSEYEKNNNLYEERYYGLNYSKEKGMYDYDVKYSLSNLKNVDNIIKMIGNYSSYHLYGKYHNLSKAGQKNINGNNFEVYDGGYTGLGGIPFTNINRFYYYINKKVLFYKMETEGYLIIEISGNGKNITQELINEVTNFKIEKKDYK